MNFTKSSAVKDTQINDTKFAKNENFILKNIKRLKNRKENMLKANRTNAENFDKKVLKKQPKNENIIKNKKLKKKIILKQSENEKEKISTKKKTAHEILRKQPGKLKMLRTHKSEKTISTPMTVSTTGRFKKRKFDLSIKEPYSFKEKFMQQKILKKNSEGKRAKTSNNSSSVCKKLSAHIRMMRLMKGMMKKLNDLQETNNFIKILDQNFVKSYEKSRSLLNRNEMLYGNLRATKYSRLSPNSISPMSFNPNFDTCVTNFVYTKNTPNFIGKQQSFPEKHFFQNKTVKTKSKFNFKAFAKTISNDIIPFKRKSNNLRKKEKYITPTNGSWDVLYDKIA